MENLSTFVRTLGNQFIRGKKVFLDPLRLDSTLLDGNSNAGTSGQVLSTTGTATQWITVGTSNVGALDDLSDVQTGTPSDAQLLRYDSEGEIWYNWTPNFLDVNDGLNELNGVILTSPVANQFLQYNGSNWVNANVLLSQLGDTSISSPSADQILVYGQPLGGDPGVNVWYNKTPNFLTTATNLDDLSNVIISLQATGDILRYNGTNWVNVPFSSLENDTLDSVTDRGSVTTNSINVGGVTTDYVQFDTTVTLGGDEVQGYMAWNSDVDTVSVYPYDSEWFNIGQDMHWHVKNGTAETLSKGTVVMAVGAVGNSSKIEVGLMVSDGTVNSKYIVGVALKDIETGEFGKVTTQGIIRGIDTSSFQEGDVLWCDPLNDGGLTNVEPAAPNLRLPIAFVVSSDQNGSIAVRIVQGNVLHELHDVNASSPSGGDLLRYDSTDGIWENFTPDYAPSSHTHDDRYYTETEVNTLLGGYLPTTGGALTGDLLIRQADSTAPGYLLVLHNSSNANGASIRFTDTQTQDSQSGTITFYHSDALSYGSGASLVLGSSETATTILANGKLMYAEGIYSKPSSGTGAGTRKDQNWDTAYGWGNHAGLYANIIHTHEIADITGLQDELNRKLESESDTLDSVTDRGATTTNNITVGGLTVGDSHFVGNETTYDNLLLRSSTGESIVLGSNTNLFFNTGATANNSVGTNRMYIDGTSGNVGIGTTSPGYLLDVDGAIHSTDITIADAIYHEGDTNTYIQFHAADQWRVVTGGVERLEVNNTQTTVQNVLVASDFVGIGTTSPAEKLDVSGNIKVSGVIYVSSTASTALTLAANDWIDIAEMAYGEHHGKIAFEWNGLSSPSSAHHGWFEIEVGTYYSSSFNYGQDTYVEVTKALAHNDFWLSAVRAVDYGSTVRIQVQVARAVTAGTFRSFVLHKNQGTVTSLTPAINNNAYTVLALANVGDVDGDYVQKAIGNRTRFSKSVAFDDNVGIGTTSPAYKLDVAGEIRLNAGNAFTDLNIKSDRTSGNLGGINFVNGSDAIKGQVYGNADGSVRVGTNGTTLAMLIDASQNVGIGTTSPSEKLSVAGNIAIVSNNSFISFNTSASSGDPKIQMGSDGDFSFINTAGITNFHIENGGNVGIGTTSPSYKLDVNGSFNATSVNVTNNISSSAGNLIVQNGAGIYSIKFTIGTSASGTAFRIANTNDVQAARATFVAETTNYKVAKIYEVVHAGNGDPVAFKVVDTGPSGEEDFSVSFSNDGGDLLCTVTNDSSNESLTLVTTIFVGGSNTSQTVSNS